jgi:hypothetical protein
MASGRQHSVIGCTIGFGLAGSAAGLLAGICWYSADARWLAPDWVADMRKGGGGNVSYWYLEKCVPLGCLAGAVGGAVFAARSGSPKAIQ